MLIICSKRALFYRCGLVCIDAHLFQHRDPIDQHWPVLIIAYKR